MQSMDLNSKPETIVFNKRQDKYPLALVMRKDFLTLTIHKNQSLQKEILIISIRLIFLKSSLTYPMKRQGTDTERWEIVATNKFITGLVFEYTKNSQP